jgi:hypothetical protein
VRVDVQPFDTYKAAERDPLCVAELNCEARGSTDGDENRAVGDGSFLDELERVGCVN